MITYHFRIFHVITSTFRSVASSSINVIKNENINASTMRVIYKNLESNTTEIKILEKASALEWARSLELDLILGMLHLIFNIN